MPDRSSCNSRQSMDWNAMDSEASEFSWGSGLEPKSVRGKPPSESGRYRGTSPPCENRVNISR